jgi:hypothetical protein
MFKRFISINHIHISCAGKFSKIKDIRAFPNNHLRATSFVLTVSGVDFNPGVQIPAMIVHKRLPAMMKIMCICCIGLFGRVQLA